MVTSFELPAFGKRLTELMRERNIDAGTLAGKVGVSSGTAKRWMKSARYPKLVRMTQLLTILQISCEDFLHGSTKEGESLLADNLD